MNDGSIVVGTSGDEAFIWDITNGMRRLKDVLIDTYGLDVEALSITAATQISADGTTVVGHDYFTDGVSYGRAEAWIATLTPTQPCPFTPGPDACTISCPCGEGEGDCDSDADCEAGLTCVQGVGANYGWPAGRDVCE